MGSSNFLRKSMVSVWCMTRKRPRTTETLARNLNYLMDKYGYSEKEVERRCGVSSKTINNMRNAKHTATVENTEKVAGVFNLDGWQMIVPHLPQDLLESDKLKTALVNYAASDQDGRDAIYRLAEREAQFAKQKPS